MFLRDDINALRLEMLIYLSPFSGLSLVHACIILWCRLLRLLAGKKYYESIEKFKKIQAQILSLDARFFWHS